MGKIKIDNRVINIVYNLLVKKINLRAVSFTLLENRRLSGYEYALCDIIWDYAGEFLTYMKMGDFKAEAKTRLGMYMNKEKIDKRAVKIANERIRHVIITNPQSFLRGYYEGIHDFLWDYAGECLDFPEYEWGINLNNESSKQENEENVDKC